MNFFSISLSWMLAVAPCITNAAPTAPAFSVSKRGTYASSSKITSSLAGSFVNAISITPVRFVIGQNSVNISSGGAVLTLTSDKKLALKINSSFVSGVAMVGVGTWKWSTPTTLGLSGTAKATTVQGVVNATWSSTVKFPSAGKAVFKLTAEGNINGSPLKVDLDVTAAK